MNVSGTSVRRRAAHRARRSSLQLLSLGVALGVVLPTMAATTATAAPAVATATVASPAVVAAAAPPQARAMAAPPAAAVAAAPPAATATDGVLRVLLFYKTNFHDSNVQARQAVRELALELGTETGEEVQIEETDNPAAFTAANLATKDAVVFTQTGGTLFNSEQRAALEGFIKAGGGFAGVHYTSWSRDTVNELDVNPFYARLVGGVSNGHPEDGNPIRPGRITVNDTAHPLAAGLPASATRTDEWYDWIVNPAQDVRTLVEVDEASYANSNTGGYQGTTHPITWCQQGNEDNGLGEGRSWFTGMGHAGDDYDEPFIRTQLKNGMAYAAGLRPTADCSPPAKDEQGTWDRPSAPTENPATDPVGDNPSQNGVTPWPLVPINAALTSDGKVQSFGSVNVGGTDATAYDWTGNDTVTQGGQTEIDIWDPTVARTLMTVATGILANSTYTDLFCAMQVLNAQTGAMMTVGGDDGLGGNAPNDGSMGVTSYTTNGGLQDEAPMNYPRWYPTATTMPNGDIVVQGGSLRGGPGGPGALTPEVYTPDSGSGWDLLEGATSALAYGNGGNGNGPDENRWWYPRAFVAPGSGNLFNITGTQMYELDPTGEGTLTPRGTLNATNGGDQGVLGNPVGATSTAAMYRPGKILQVGGGTWGNGGGADGARAALTVDITGGTANPVVAAAQPMEYQRHWATSTILPDGNVIVTGGGRENNGRDDTVTNAEIWNPDTGEWTTVEVPHERARLYHSTALLLPDGRVMIGGGGAPGARNYTDAEFYSPAYLFEGDQRAVRPEVTAPAKIGYNGTFDLETTSDVSKVTLVRNGSVTHGFNNGQSFQELKFSESAGGITVDAPQDGTYAPPGSYMVFVFDANGTPSVASMVKIDPTVKMDVRTPEVVEQFEYPRNPVGFTGGASPATYEVAPGDGRMTPWSVDKQVQLIRGTEPSQGALTLDGYHLALGTGDLDRSIEGLDAGADYRISLRYARDSRAAGTAPATATVQIGDLTGPLTSSRASNGAGDTVANSFETYVGTFTAGSRTETLRLTGPASGPGMMIDNLVITAVDPGLSDVPVLYELDEGAGRTAANTGTDSSVGDATLTGATGWSEDGIYGGSLDLPGGAQANAVDLPDNLLQGEADFTTSFWVRPETPRTNWAGLLHIGSGLGGDGSFFQIQTQTQADGFSGLAATFKAKGSGLEERIRATPAQDLELDEWNYVAFTRQGATGTLYLNGEAIGSRNDLTIDMTDVGPTENNWLGRNGFPDDAFNGQMDDVRAYDSTLTAEDIAALYADGTAVETTTTLTASPPSPAPFGTPVTVSATVTPADGTAAAAGTAQLQVDGVPTSDPVALDPAGRVTFEPVDFSTAGDKTLEVVYNAGEGFRDSTTGPQPYTVSRRIPTPGEGVPVHYKFDEGAGTTSVNSGSDTSVGEATLTGNTSWTPNGQFGAGIDLPGGSNANAVDLPDNLLQDEEAFSTSFWVRPDAPRTNWSGLFQIGDGLGGDDAASFFQIQTSTQAAGATGLAATFKAEGSPLQERVYASPTTDINLDQWNHVAFTRQGATGTLYLNGEAIASRDDLTIDMSDIGPTTNNWLGRNGFPDPAFNGLMDDVRLYDYELTEAQVVALNEGEPEPVNTTPTAVSDTGSTNAGTALTVTAPGVLANDTDAESNPLTATGATQPANGMVVLNADGSYTYTPRTGFFGTDSFTYTANDGTTSSAPATVTITVRPVPTTPPPTTPPAPPVPPVTPPAPPIAAKTQAVVKVNAPRSIRRGQQAKVKVKVKTEAGVRATGTVTLKVAGQKFKARVKNGRVVFRLPDALRAGTVRLKAVYSGSTTVTRAKGSRTMTVRR